MSAQFQRLCCYALAFCRRVCWNELYAGSYVSDCWFFLFMKTMGTQYDCVQRWFDCLGQSNKIKSIRAQIMWSLLNVVTQSEAMKYFERETNFSRTVSLSRFLAKLRFNIVYFCKSKVVTTKLTPCNRTVGTTNFQSWDCTYWPGLSISVLKKVVQTLNMVSLLNVIKLLIDWNHSPGIIINVVTAGI